MFVANTIDKNPQTVPIVHTLKEDTDESHHNHKIRIPAQLTWYTKDCQSTLLDSKKGCRLMLDHILQLPVSDNVAVIRTPQLARVSEVCFIKVWIFLCNSVSQCDIGIRLDSLSTSQCSQPES